MKADNETLCRFLLMLMFVCFSRYFTHSRARYGQGDPRPVLSGASGQRHGRPPWRIIWDHHRHRQAHWCQWQPSTFHPEWVTRQHPPAPAETEMLTEIRQAAQQHVQKRLCFGPTVLSVCPHMCSNCCTASNSPALSVYSPCTNNPPRSREPNW